MYKKYLKRIFDFVCSLLALIVFSPLLLIIALLVRIKLGSPVIYKQERPGLNEKIFKLYKFRTMNNKKNSDGILLPDIQRLTPLGEFLRNYSLDELPELYCIFKGDMSFVGPRPLLMKYLPLYNQEQRHRHDVKPGLTGLAQINGRNTSTWEERFKYDVKYVNNVGFYMDIKIILQTIVSVIRREGINSQVTTKFTMTEFLGSESEQK
jgi:undecaprenyl phosphate N,N'-diacetylbacillosamine 1-phosphate transferase